MVKCVCKIKTWNEQQSNVHSKDVYGANGNKPNKRSARIVRCYKKKRLVSEFLLVVLISCFYKCLHFVAVLCRHWAGDICVHIYFTWSDRVNHSLEINAMILSELSASNAHTHTHTCYGQKNPPSSWPNHREWEKHVKKKPYSHTDYTANDNNVTDFCLIESKRWFVHFVHYSFNAY